MTIKRILWLCAALTPTTLVTPAFAQDVNGYPTSGYPEAPPPGGMPQQQAPAQQIPPQMRADITAGMRYPLPANFMPRARQTLQNLSEAGIQPPNSTGLSLQQTIAAMRDTPGVEQILSQQGFTPETFVMGMTAFGMTLAATNGQKLPAEIPSPDPANVKLFHEHPEDVTKLMEAMGTPPQQQGQQPAQ